MDINVTFFNHQAVLRLDKDIEYFNEFLIVLSLRQYTEGLGESAFTLVATRAHEFARNVLDQSQCCILLLFALS